MADSFQDQITIVDGNGNATIVLTALNGTIQTERGGRRTLIDEDHVHVGRSATSGPTGPASASIIMVGDKGRAGKAVVRSSEGVSAFTIDGEAKETQCRTKVTVFNEQNEDVLHFDPKFAVLRIGGKGGNEGDLTILDAKGEVVIHLDGKTGDIQLRGADCAEAFPIADAATLEPGSVCVIGTDGTLEPCRDRYDTRVAGIVAGAGDLRPGIVLGQGAAGDRAVPLSLSGRVWCKVDAGAGSIRPGDLLTTSDTPGHAMRAEDAVRRTGAIVGKALASLPTGVGLVPVLVGLQ